MLVFMENHHHSHKLTRLTCSRSPVDTSRSQDAPETAELQNAEMSRNIIIPHNQWLNNHMS